MVTLAYYSIILKNALLIPEATQVNFNAFKKQGSKEYILPGVCFPLISGKYKPIVIKTKQLLLVCTRVSGKKTDCKGTGKNFLM